MGYLHVFWIGRKARFSQHSFPWRTGLTRRSRRRIIAIPTWRPRRGIAVTRMRSPVPSDGLEPIEPDRVVGLVPLQDGPDPRLLVTRHDHFVDPLEADPDPLAVVLERLWDHCLQLVADATGVGDLHRPGGVIDARKEAHEQRAEDLARRLQRLHESQREGDEA